MVFPPDRGIALATGACPDMLCSSYVDFADLLSQLRPFLLRIANDELPAALRAKGGASDLVQETIGLEWQPSYSRLTEKLSTRPVVRNQRPGTWLRTGGSLVSEGPI